MRPASCTVCARFMATPHSTTNQSCHWAARLGRLSGEPIRGRHTALGEGTMELELAINGRLVSVSGNVAAAPL